MNIIVKYKCFVAVLIILITFGITGLNNIDYEKFYMNSGVIVDKGKMKIYCDKVGLKTIANNKKIIIEGENFAYKNIIINDIVFNDTYYFEVLFDVDLNNKYNIQNNLVDFKISLDKKTILKYMLSKIGGWNERNR